MKVGTRVCWKPYGEKVGRMETKGTVVATVPSGNYVWVVFDNDDPQGKDMSIKELEVLSENLVD